MSYFINPFCSDFEASWVLGDRQHIPKYKCLGNTGRSTTKVMAHNQGPYDLSGNDADGDSNDTLVFNFAKSSNPKGWATLSIDITATATSSSAVTPSDIVTDLNADSTFGDFFIAELERFDGDDAINRTRVAIRSLKPETELKFYVSIGRADTVLNFNKYIGVAELPTFFERHTIDNRFTYTDSQNQLIALDPGANTVDANVIDNAINASGVSLALDSSTVQADWQLLKGRSGIFTFQNITVDGSDRITEIIEYHAGAVAGDLGRKIAYSYTSSNTKPDQITEIPYTLESGDLVTP